LANGASAGSVPVDSNGYEFGDVVVVADNSGGLIRDGFVFLGWAYSRTATVADFVVTGTSVTPYSFAIYSNVMLFAVWGEVTFMVTYEPGTHGTFAAVRFSGLHYSDRTPAAPTVTGEMGWRFTNWSPAVSATVTGNVTYVAQWEQEPSASPSPSPSASASPSPSASSSPTPTPTPTLIPTPTATVPPPVVNKGKWAVVNLVLSIVGVVLVYVAVLRALLLKKKDDDDAEDDEETEKMRKNVEGQSQSSLGQGGDDQGVYKFTESRSLWLVTAVVFSVVGVVVFLFTEDWHLLSAWVDRWTIVNVAILILEIVAIMLVFKRKKVKTYPEKSNQNNSSNTNTLK
jgi:hypothetical protein